MRFHRLIHEIEAVEGVVDIDTRHHLVDGLYGRSVLIRKDNFVVGANHKVEGFAIAVGDISSWSVAGGYERFTGVTLIRSKPGMRIVFAHEDTTWFTVHPNTTGGEDVEAIEAAIVDHPEWLMSRRTNKETSP